MFLSLHSVLVNKDVVDVHELGGVARLVERVVVESFLSFDYARQVDQTAHVHLAIDAETRPKKINNTIISNSTYP